MGSLSLLDYMVIISSTSLFALLVGWILGKPKIIVYKPEPPVNPKFKPTKAYVWDSETRKYE